ncbi:hypothetical protein ACFWU3_10575 [Streptomyces sp. NPDC058685]|uniref:hypothetical protein n=1 Tax=Streptomyces sp. NPDC058685 TaxID=3346598 RepID=UPI00366909D8
MRPSRASTATHPQARHPRAVHAQGRRPRAVHAQGPVAAPTPQYGCPPRRHAIGVPTGHLAPATARKKSGRDPAIAVVATAVLGTLARGGVFLALSGRNDDKEPGGAAPSTPYGRRPEFGPCGGAHGPAWR